MKINKKPICLIMFGAQASGKGTQAEILKEELNLNIISTGNLLRDIKKQNSSLAQQVKNYYDQGKFVPDEIIVKIIKQEIQRINMKNGLLFDGFPRNISQIKIFEELISEYNFKAVKAIYLEIKDKIVIKRISSRRVCDKCNSPHIVNNNELLKCTKCSGNLVMRSDDKPEAIKVRLDQYHKNTKPVIDYFDQENKLIKINGEPEINIVSSKIKDSLKENGIVQ